MVLKPVIQEIASLSHTKPAPMRPTSGTSYQEDLRLCDWIQSELEPGGNRLLSIALFILTVPHRE